MGYLSKILTILLLVAFGFQSFAIEVITKEIVVVKEKGAFNRPIEITLMSDGALFVASQFPEDERYIQYGPHKIDRNLPVQVMSHWLFDGIFKYEGKFYLLGKRKEKDHRKVFEVSFRHGQLPDSTYVKDMAGAISLSTFNIVGMGKRLR